MTAELSRGETEVIAGDSTLAENTSMEALVADLTDPVHTAVRSAEGEKLPILAHFSHIEDYFHTVYLYFVQAAQETLVVSYGGEWLLDNYYIVQQALQQVDENMPSSYYKSLPKLTSGLLKGYPRVYLLAHAVSNFLHSRVSVEEQNRFLLLYQAHTTLSISELWAWPTMLRIAIIENLMMALDRSMKIRPVPVDNLIPADVQVTYRQDRDSDFIIANCITSLRAINAQDWSQFFEDHSLVEAVLRRDPDDVYARMDFDTRDRYRRRIEQLARRSVRDELEVAETVRQLAAEAQSRNENPQSRSHVGYYLIDDGLRETKRSIAYQQSLREVLATILRTHAATAYLASIWLLAAFNVFLVLRFVLPSGASFLQAIVTTLLTCVPAIFTASQLANWLVTQVVAPDVLPKLDFSKGIPTEFQSIVVIPTLLSDLDEVQSLAQQLEQHYLRNADPNLYYAILADFVDADQETLPEDQMLVQSAEAFIQSLNTRYGDAHRRPFFFLLRQRQWNSAEEKWMGYERKRGKLAEFNQLLLDPAASTSYAVILGDVEQLGKMRYVITLDSDTILPREISHRLIGTFAHPLNQARFDDSGRQLSAGYTILQPRIEILPSVVNQTAFTRVFAGERGLDLYTLSVSDVYQDLFKQGIYVGKGIYDVAAFERSLEGRTPENALLSHDLFEGLHGRVGLATDIVLLEDYPAHYLAHMSRVHRWVRGDWQLLPWLLPRVPSTHGNSLPNIFSILDKWKILDNLIRSLLHPSLFIIIVMSWLWLPGSVFVWTGFAMGVLLIPFLISVFNQMQVAPLTGSLRVSQQRDLILSILHWALSVAFLPYEALVRLDAIVVTLVRLRQRKHLLEWATSASEVRQFGNNPANLILQRMLGVALLAAAIALGAFWLKPDGLFASVPLVVIWLGGPKLAQYISQVVEHKVPEISEENLRKLRTLSRRTWLFFEEYVGPLDHWLPPDHYQQTPVDKIGHYTSPTNIGLMIVSIVAAYDRGYIGLLDMITRLHFTFESIEKLERYRGHLLNWYNTKTLQALIPRYVSTVDNGNFAACLLIVREASDDIYHSPILRPQRWQGVIDTLDVLSEILERIEAQQSSPVAAETVGHIESMRAHVVSTIEKPGLWIEPLERLANEDWQALSDTIAVLVENLTQADAQLLHDLRLYLGRLQHHLSSIRRDIDLLLPWLPAIAESAPDWSDSSTEVQQGWFDLLQLSAQLPTVVDLPALYEKIGQQLQSLADLLPHNAERARDWCAALQSKLCTASGTYDDLLQMARKGRRQIDAEFAAMDFSFLYNQQRHQFHIGYNVDSEQLDNSFYDMLASEARIASFLAIAKRDVSQKHWLHLSRPVTHIRHVQTLLSWSGTMFEYLMPLLFMRHYPNTLLHQSYAAIVEHQINFGRQHEIPWGVSESGFYAFDSSQNYQYRAFGLPELGFKRSPGQERVVAPYASILALSLRPQAVVENIDALIAQGALTGYGFVEAVDYTTTRLPLGQDRALVKEYMAHHQSMIFIALANYLHNNIMVDRFHRSPIVESVELLLMEQIPQEATIKQLGKSDIENLAPASAVSTQPWTVAVDSPAPEVHLLSNGRYSVMISNAGSGYSQWRARAITRWQADSTLDNWGQWFYLFDEQSRQLWSPTRQPVDNAEYMKTIFHLGRVEFQSRAHDITSRLEVLVPPDDDLEIRKLTLTNHSENARRLTVCSYGEMVLAPQLSDQRHPAFNKIFIESEFLPEPGALLFRRRPRSAQDAPIFVLHMLIVPGDAQSTIQFETDRKRFLGRNCSTQNPAAFSGPRAALSGTTGATLDPIMAIASSISIPPHSTIELAYVTLAAETQHEAVTVAERYRAWEELDRAANQLRYHSEGELRRLGLNANDIARFQRLLSSLIYPNPAFRAPQKMLAANNKGQPGLWAYGISGDYPMVLLQISDEEQLELIYELVMAHRYWRDRGFASTLVILNQSDTGYMQELYNLIYRLLMRSGNGNWLNRHDGIFILRSDQMNDADYILLSTAARVWLDGVAGSLTHQMAMHRSENVTLPLLQPSLVPAEPDDSTSALEEPGNLLFDNGYGGFTADGREYVIRVDATKKTPSPWINVIANPAGGFIVSEVGGGFTWAENSGEHRLSTWRNDPVTDMPGEAIYIRDEETAAVWSPTPMPAGSDMTYIVRHGAGYSVFEHQRHDLRQTTGFFMAPDAPVKFVRLNLKNAASRPRRITITYYMEWVLGPLREITQQYLIHEFDAANQTLLAHNPYSIEFGSHYAFVTADKTLHGMTADRTEFLGRGGSLAQPAALRRIGLGGNVSAGIDPCAALQLHVELPIDGEAEVCFIIGSAESRTAALGLSQQYRSKEVIQQAWEQTVANWRSILDSIVVRTPDPAMNLLLPWLLYQTLSCRIWGRSALYQSSGAYGFRDQLQDVAAITHVHPDLTREHILRAAGSQFEEGDVLHWWHPPSGRGVKTRFADDLVWLPFVVGHYVTATGDESLLHSEVPFLKGEALRSDEEERYGFYESTSERYSIYEHCRRAMNKAYSLGRHHLPLMKAGDWNDGMNRVGIKGEGESVWMGWFLYTTMERFLPLCRQMDDSLQAETYQEWMQELKAALENAGWDGDWYRRAYYDDGTPLGSAQNKECRIDSLPQSWAVLSGAADTARATAAMAAAEAHLVRRDDQLIQLFAPPFDQTIRDPGYIKGYPPGIRENGGQYTHAALWLAWAFAELGKGDQAESLFRLLNPINHSDTTDKAAHYGVEPYVIAADVYSVHPHTGRGGWTWYTGSSGWMYRLGIEAILGLRREGNRLRIEPHTASDWASYEVDYRYGRSTYHIRVVNHSPVNSIEMDGELLTDHAVSLVDDGRSHQVIVHLETWSI